MTPERVYLVAKGTSNIRFRAFDELNDKKEWDRDKFQIWNWSCRENPNCRGDLKFGDLESAKFYARKRVTSLRRALRRHKEKIDAFDPDEHKELFDADNLDRGYDYRSELEEL